MRFAGRIYKDRRYWLAEVPIFEAMTQGRTRAEALAMVKDWFESMADQRGFHVEVIDRGSEIHVSSTDTRTLIRLLLQRRREMSGLSLAEVAQRLGAKSRNAYARYERGQAVPSLAKLDELLRAVAPGNDFVLVETVAV